MSRTGTPFCQHTSDRTPVRNSPNSLKCLSDCESQWTSIERGVDQALIPKCLHSRGHCSFTQCSHYIVVNSSVYSDHGITTAIHLLQIT